MAELIKREWRSGPRNVRKVAWGYMLQVRDRSSLVDLRANIILIDGLLEAADS